MKNVYSGNSIGGPFPRDGRIFATSLSISIVNAPFFSVEGAVDLYRLALSLPAVFDITGGGGGFRFRDGLPLRLRIDFKGGSELEDDLGRTAAKFGGGTGLGKFNESGRDGKGP